MQRPLLPRPRDTDTETQLRLPPPKRQHIGPHGPIANHSIAPKRRPIASACESCRRRKEKCDGGRPMCGPCARRGVDCSNVAENDESTSSRAVRKQYAALKEENKQLNELYSLLYKLDHTEATHVLARLRASGDPIAVLRDVKDSYLLLSNPDTFEHPTFQHPILERLDNDALRASTFRVNARPWTVVAGDGIVSELISSFFTWDDAFFYPFIHRRAFLDDMRRNNIDAAKYCSPFLVNAICATRCFTSQKVKMFSHVTKKDMAGQFLSEAKKLLDMEEGRVSLPTAQGLALLFTLSAYRGTDRAGMIYRFACYDMLRQLNLEQDFEEIQDSSTKAVKREIISKAVWGFFCFESIVGYVYLQLSLVKPPRIPRIFDIIKEDSPQSENNHDILGNAYTESSSPPPFVPGVLDATCDLSLMLYGSMIRNSKEAAQAEGGQHVDARRKLAQDVFHWIDNLPRQLQMEPNFTPQTGFLRIYAHEVIISALRPLPPDTAAWESLTTKDICLQCCRTDQEITERYFSVYSFRDYSCMTLCALYNTLSTIASYMPGPIPQDLFSRTCQVLLHTAKDYPMARFILQGIQALLWSLKKEVPAGAAACFENLGVAKDQLHDVPVAFVLPPVEAVRDILGNERDEGQLGVEIGVLLTKWAALSVDKEPVEGSAKK